MQAFYVTLKGLRDVNCRKRVPHSKELVPGLSGGSIWPPAPQCTHCTQGGWGGGTASLS